jgi:hypothetical protein
LQILKLKLSFGGEDEFKNQILTSKTAFEQQGGDKRPAKYLNRSRSFICYGAHRHPELGNPHWRTGLGSFGGILTPWSRLSIFLGV